MQQFNASAFLETTAYLVGMRQAIATNLQVQAGLPWGMSVSDWTRIQTHLGEFTMRCREMGLVVTAKGAERFSDDLKRLQASHTRTNLQQGDKTQDMVVLGPQEKAQVEQGLASITGRLHDELSGKMFLHLDADEAASYASTEPAFGLDVAARFPNATEDIAEAEKCFALGRYTASVFHLMRVIELTVHALWSRLHLTGTMPPNWQNILDQINKQISAMSDKGEARLCAQASANLFNIKLAWRNEVMHPKQTYTRQEAQEIRDASRAFVRHLATFL